MNIKPWVDWVDGSMLAANPASYYPALLFLTFIEWLFSQFGFSSIVIARVIIYSASRTKTDILNLLKQNAVAAEARHERSEAAAAKRQVENDIIAMNNHEKSEAAAAKRYSDSQAAAKIRHEESEKAAKDRHAELMDVQKTNAASSNTVFKVLSTKLDAYVAAQQNISTLITNLVAKFAVFEVHLQKLQHTTEGLELAATDVRLQHLQGATERFQQQITVKIDELFRLLTARDTSPPSISVAPVIHVSTSKASTSNAKVQTELVPTPPPAASLSISPITAVSSEPKTPQLALSMSPISSVSSDPKPAQLDYSNVITVHEVAPPVDSSESSDDSMWEGIIQVMQVLDLMQEMNNGQRPVTKASAVNIIAKVLSAINSLKSHLAAKQTTIETDQDNIDQLTAQVQQSAIELDGMRADIRTKDSALAAKEDELATVRTQLEHAKADMVKQSSQLQVTRTNVENLERLSEEAKKSLSLTISRQNTQLAIHETTIAEQADTINNFKRSAKDLETKLVVTQSRLDQRKINFDAAQTMIQQLRVVNRSLQDSNDEMQAQKQSKQTSDATTQCNILTNLEEDDDNDFPEAAFESFLIQTGQMPDDSTAAKQDASATANTVSSSTAGHEATLPPATRVSEAPATDISNEKTPVDTAEDLPDAAKPLTSIMGKAPLRDLAPQVQQQVSAIFSSEYAEKEAKKLEHLVPKVQLPSPKTKGTSLLKSTNPYNQLKSTGSKRDAPAPKTSGEVSASSAQSPAGPVPASSSLEHDGASGAITATTPKADEPTLSQAPSQPDRDASDSDDGWVPAPPTRAQDCYRCYAWFVGPLITPPWDESAKIVDPTTHNLTCTGRGEQFLFHCEHCGMGFDDELDFRANHRQACEIAAKGKVDFKAFNPKTGRRKSEEAEEAKAAEEAATAVSSSSKNKKKGQGQTGDSSSADAGSFFCTHCGMGFNDKTKGDFYKKHQAPCKEAAKATGQMNRFDRKTGKPNYGLDASAGPFTPSKSSGTSRGPMATFDKPSSSSTPKSAGRTTTGRGPMPTFSKSSSSPTPQGTSRPATPHPPMPSFKDAPTARDLTAEKEAFDSMWNDGAGAAKINRY